jgi:type II secretory pathway pseudopilin PulG
MNRGGNASPTSGFTIVETLIVLAVTSTLLISAMVSMSGRQARTEFQVATQNAVRDYQSIISQIESGRYTTSNNFTCETSGFNDVSFAPPTGGDTQGANKDCTYLGLALVFGQNPATYKKYVLAGSRLYNDATPASAKDLTESNPTTAEVTATTHLITRGLEYAGAQYINESTGLSELLSDGTVPVALRLLVDQNGDAGATGAVAGSSKVSVHSSVPLNPADIVATINDTPSDQRKKGVELCFSSTGLDKSVIISIGNGWGNKVDSVVKDGKKCGWPI